VLDHLDAKIEVDVQMAEEEDAPTVWAFTLGCLLETIHHHWMKTELEEFDC
jgi:hypothetical protein